MELSILCDVDIALIIFDTRTNSISGSQQLFQYSSINFETLMKKYQQYDGQCEVLENKDLSALKLPFTNKC